ncbi:MAG: hypothetical protein K8J31_26950, partial [Anaerolineae bacterium]|nr:hypothetical protein [Anaerolineae bacterium]
IQAAPNRTDLYLNLSAVYLLDEESDAARQWLEKAQKLTDDEATRADIERMLLAADDPELETRLGEITDIVNAGNTLEVEDVEFLEQILKQVPSYAEVCVLLAKAYLNWEEVASALETLLDGYKYSSDDPEIVTLLSQTLWESGEEDLAFSYLNKGLIGSPHYVPLLALAGQCLFEDGQTDAARAYLLRAEAISPRDPALVRVRQHIGRSLNQ